MVKEYYLLPLLLILVLQCSHEKDIELKARYEINKVNTFTIKSDTSDFIIGRLAPFFEFNFDVNRYSFYDEVFSRFVITDTLGYVLETISKKGRGPDELLKVTSFNYDEKNNLVVYDGGQFLVKIFDTVGKVVNSFEPEMPEYAIASRNLVAYNGDIIFGIIETKYLRDLRTAASSKILKITDYDGSFIRAFGSYDSLTNQSNISSIFPVLALERGTNNIYIVQTNSYIIQVLDLVTGVRKKVIRVKPPNFNAGNEYISPYLSIAEIQEKSVGLSYTSQVYVTAQGIVLYYENMTESWNRTRNHNDKVHYIAFYDRKGNLLDELKVPFRVANIISDKLFLIENDNPDNYTIGVYRIDEKI